MRQVVIKLDGEVWRDALRGKQDRKKILLYVVAAVCGGGGKHCTVKARLINYRAYPELFVSGMHSPRIIFVSEKKTTNVANI